MHVHKYEKLWLAAALLLIVGLIGTITFGAVGAGVTMVDDSGGTVDPSSLSDHPQFGDPGVVQTGPNEYEVYVVSQQFSFSPDPIRVPAGSEVTFHITSRDVIHGYQVVGTNANTMAVPGQVSEMTVRFDETDEVREYGILCNEYCGAAHHTMEGKIVVVPADEYAAGQGGDA
jgi:cytochrome c oxidase subunit 2